MGLRNLLYKPYERQLVRTLRDEGESPRHIGVILDGNRRWAKASGESASHGHQRGADKISDVLGWSEQAGVEVVTLWMLSTDNLSRDAAELGVLLEIICATVEGLADEGRWRLQHVGAIELLPADAAARLTAAVARTAGA